MLIDVSKLRNVVLLSHSGAGKTALAESVVFKTGDVTRQGNVQDGNTVSDFEPEEVKRQSSIQTTVLPCTWKGTKINILDTPGYEDFLGESHSAVRVVEGAILVVDATSGVEVGTNRDWRTCEKNSLPRIVLVNKMDRENADFSRTVQDLQSSLDRKCVPINIPIGTEDSFEGVVDLLDPQNTPDGLDNIIDTAKEQLVEIIAETDDDLTTKYLEGDEISKDELSDALAKGIVAGDIVPVMAASVTKSIGVDALLDAVQRYLPSPEQSVETDSGDSIEPSLDGPLSAFVFKTTADPFVGRLSLFRVYRGTFKANSEVFNINKSQSERIGQIYKVFGKNQEAEEEIGPGDIGAVAKLSDTTTNDTLCDEDNPVTFEQISFPKGNYTMSVAPKSKADVDKMSSSLSKIVEEDSSIVLTREPDTGETLLSGLGDVHLDVAIQKIQRKFTTELVLNTPRVPYKETITSVFNAEYKHKKQSGGHGQYGHVNLRLEPTAKGEGFQFASEVVGGAVPKEYISSVEKGIVKALDGGIGAGYPVVDLKVVLYDGSYHDVDSSGISFEIAASHAVRDGVRGANPSLLEPVMTIAVNVPDTFTGDVIGDINGKRGRILGMVPEAGYTTIEAEVPQSELLHYATELRSQTQGRGTYTAELNKYEPVPFNIAQKLMNQGDDATDSKT